MRTRGDYIDPADLEHGDIVLGPFFSDGRTGVGICDRQAKRGLLKGVGKGYAPIRVLVGDRVDGGYATELVPAPQLRLRAGV
jgi:hypothetical protein